jgi:hypothetical protein
LAFLPELNTAVKRIVSCQRDGNGKPVSDGTLAVCKKATEGDAGKASFHAIWTEQKNTMPLTCC